MMDPKKKFIQLSTHYFLNKHPMIAHNRSQALFIFKLRTVKKKLRLLYNISYQVQRNLLNTSTHATQAQLLNFK